MAVRPKRQELMEHVASKSEVKNYRIQSSGNADKPDNAGLLGEGGSAVVFRVDQQLHEDVYVTRAMKFFYYRDDIAEFTQHQFAGPVSEQDFIAEVVNLANVSHENLVRVVDAGVLKFKGLSVPFLVSQYVDGPTLRNLIEGKSPSAQHNIQKIRDALGNPSDFFQFIIQLAAAACYLHSLELAHCDIAPKNIFIECSNTIRPVLGDLGIAKSLKRTDDSEVFIAGSKSYAPPSVQALLNKRVPYSTFRELQPHWDLFGFCKSVLELLDAFPEFNKSSWKSPLEAALKQAMEGTKYVSLSEIKHRIEFLQPIHREVALVEELSSAVSGKARKLMPIAPLLLTSRTRRLTEHPSLLRLAQVPQLTVAENVFPGAKHTRYEHSLGVMETTRRYLLALLDQPEFLGHLSKSQIETCLLCGLFWNITRFPFSNLIHEIKGRHQELFSSFSRKEILPQVLSIADRRGRTIFDLVSDLFPAVSTDSVKRILLGHRRDFEEEDLLIYSFFNSSLDTRVLDFVRRDSLHLGITSSEAVSLDDLLPHLTIYAHRLALKATGVTVAEQVISLRYWLFNRIYWSRPNRSYVAMLRHMLLELAEETDSSFLIDLRGQVLNCTEDQVRSFLLEKASTSSHGKLVDLANLLRGTEHRLFPIAFDVCPRDNEDMANACRIIGGMDHSQLKAVGFDLRQHLGKTLNNIENKVAVLVDVPDEPGDSKLGEDIHVIADRGVVTNLKKFSGIVGGVNHSFNESLRRLRVFVHPDAYPKEKQARITIQEAIRDYLLQLH
jgi:HD superfamily phosphohydrolase